MSSADFCTYKLGEYEKKHDLHVWVAVLGFQSCPGILATAQHGLNRWFTINCMVGWLYSAPSDALVSCQLPGMV